MDKQSRTKGTNQPRVFLSYAYEDRAVAESIAEHLKSAGTQVFADRYELSVGDSLISKTESALSSSDYVVVLLSPNSVRSNWVQSELAGAFSRDMINRAVTLLPVLIADCEVPAPLANLRYFDLRADTEKGIDELIWELRSAPQIDFSRLNARQFEQLVADILSKIGFKIDAVKTDGGIDIVASSPHQDAFGTGKAQHWLVQAKHYAHGRADLKSVRELVSQISADTENNTGVVVTSGQFTSAVQEWATSQRELGIRLQLIDGTGLKRLLLRHPDVATKYFEEVG